MPCLHAAHCQDGEDFRDQRMKRTRLYRELLLEGLRDPEEANAYLWAAKLDSPEAFVQALADVKEVHAKLAEILGVKE